MCLAFRRAISASKGTKDCALQALDAGQLPEQPFRRVTGVPRLGTEERISSPGDRRGYRLLNVFRVERRAGITRVRSLPIIALNQLVQRIEISRNICRRLNGYPDG